VDLKRIDWEKYNEEWATGRFERDTFKFKNEGPKIDRFRGFIDSTMAFRDFFSIGEMLRNVCCPLCSYNIPERNIKSLGFSECKYYIEGGRCDDDCKKDEVYIESESGVSRSDDNFLLYSQGKRLWSYTNIVVRKL